MFVQGSAREPKNGRSGWGRPRATTDSLDPGPIPISSPHHGLGAIGTTAHRDERKGEITPDLAESFEPSDRGQEWVFKLRRASPSTTQERDAADVVASYQHHMGKDSKFGGQVDPHRIDTITADGDNVVFTLKEPTPTSRSTPATITSRSCREGQRRRLAVGHPHRPFSW